MEALGAGPQHGETPKDTNSASQPSTLSGLPRSQTEQLLLEITPLSYTQHVQPPKTADGGGRGDAAGGDPALGMVDSQAEHGAAKKMGFSDVWVVSPRKMLFESHLLWCSTKSWSFPSWNLWLSAGEHKLCPEQAIPEGWTDGIQFLRDEQMGFT